MATTVKKKSELEEFKEEMRAEVREQVDELYGVIQQLANILYTHTHDSGGNVCQRILPGVSEDES